MEIDGDQGPVMNVGEEADLIDGNHGPVMNVGEEQGLSPQLKLDDFDFVIGDADFNELHNILNQEDVDSPEAGQAVGNPVNQVNDGHPPYQQDLVLNEPEEAMGNNVVPPPFPFVDDDDEEVDANLVMETPPLPSPITFPFPSHIQSHSHSHCCWTRISGIPQILEGLSYPFNQSNVSVYDLEWRWNTAHHQSPECSGPEFSRYLWQDSASF
ncbi:hypothetical protein MKX03_009407 [Papaver bracteatum]|nr:hypothetical protein MKX03_009407 [Papaver bracteatum]